MHPSLYGAFKLTFSWYIGRLFHDTTFKTEMDNRPLMVVHLYYQLFHLCVLVALQNCLRGNDKKNLSNTLFEEY